MSLLKIRVDMVPYHSGQAASHNNADASARLTALSQLHPETLSRAQHESITHNKLVRRHTQAKEGSDAAGRSPIRSDGRYASRVAQNAMEASSKIMPSTSEGPNPSTSPSPPASTIPRQAASGPRIHHFGRPSIESRYSARPLTGSASPPRPQSPVQKPIFLSDPPVPTAGSPQPQDQLQQTSASSRPSTASGGATVSQTPPKKGPTTFQEMGYQSQALDGKECVIM